MAGFDDEEHWKTVYGDLSGHGVNLDQFVGERSSLSCVRVLGRAISNEKRPLGLTSPIDKLTLTWERSVARLYEQVEAIEDMIIASDYGRFPFGVAIPNVNFVETSADETQAYLFLSQEDLIDKPAAAPDCAVTLLYR